MRNTVPITEIKQIYEKAFDAISFGIQIVDASGRIIYCNRDQEIIDDLPLTLAEGKYLTELYRVDVTKSLLLQVIETGSPIFKQEQTYYTALGKKVSIICNVIPLRIDEHIVGAVAITSDSNRNTCLPNNTINGQLLYGDDFREMEMKATSLVERITFTDIIGTNPKLSSTRDKAKRIAAGDSPVVICGETGTGKELYAHSIHNASIRRNSAFVAINCAAIPESLLEGILFGTTKGAFTGAIDRPGLFEEANKGTLFLDEINSMSPVMQGKILRVLQEGILRRVGGTRDIMAHPRIISSMNTEPMEAINKGTIRSDLFFRLGVIQLIIPPLRERREDIPLLTDYFIRRYKTAFRKKVVNISGDVQNIFARYTWPGNVRELKNAIECALSLMDDDECLLERRHLPEHLVVNSDDPDRWNDNTKKNIRVTARDMERTNLLEALEQTNGNITAAAKILGMTRQSLQYRMKRLGLSIKRELSI